jgi:gas vesicle protein
MLDTRKKSRSAWFVAGIGLGALTGILLAPQSGRETRKALAASVDDGMDRVAYIGRRARKHMTNIVESGKKELARKKEQVGTAVDAVKVFLKRVA